MARIYDQYVQHMQKVADVGHSIAVLSWDKEVNLPKGSAAKRSQQIATLSGITHELFTDAKFGRLLQRLYAMKNLSRKEKKNVSLTLREYKKVQKFSQEFVIKRSHVVSKAYHAWIAAREANDYDLYKDALQELIEIKREESKIIGRRKHPYNALLDQYESGANVAELDKVFSDAKRGLKKLISELNSSTKIKTGFLRKHYPQDKQWAFGLKVLEHIGYDFEKGRQDLSTHPFTTSFSSEDVRVTTRVVENDFANMTWSCIHEGGHALYEQGLPIEDYGLPTGSAISLGIHESQSRLWENHVGRSMEYWTYMLPKLKKQFPENLKKVSLDKFYRGINKVAPNLIRTEADELHYHFHVMIRYELEKKIMEGKLNASNLKTAWNRLYKSYIGVEVPDDNQGILQDIHWSHGSFGYFPTYSIGSFYAAQFFHQACQDIPKLKKQLRKGKTDKLLTWLRENIHQYGQLYDAKGLCRKVTGEPLNFKYFMDYAREKYSSIYGIEE